MKKAYGDIKSATLHTTTYNGFAEECATAIEAINIMEEENYHEKSLNIEKITKNRCKKLLEKFDSQILEYRGKGSLHGIYFKTDSGFGKILSLIPFSMTRDKKFLSKIISASISNWLFKNYKILVLFSTTENSGILFAPSLIINEKEINYFFDSLEETLEHGIWKIVSKFASKQFSSSLRD